MNTSKLPCDIGVSWLGNSECRMEFHSDVEGIATTYANLYRRALLQSVPKMAIAGIKCVADGKIVSNLFQVVEGLKESLIDVNHSLRSAVFNIDTEDDIVIIRVDVNDKFKLSDLTDRNNYSVSVGDISKIDLVSDDTDIMSVVGNHDISLYLYFRNGVGYLQKDVNTVKLLDVVGNDDIGNWIVTDSQHRGVMKVSYNSNVQLGRQTVILHIYSYESNVKEVLVKCTDTILDHINNFRALIN